MEERQANQQPRGRHKASRLKKHDIQVRSEGGDSQTERERNAGKEGGAKRGKGNRNGSSHSKQ
jgi:hypothetical protein